MKEIVESVGRIEPCLIEPVPRQITDIVAEIASASKELGNRVHPKTARSLRFLVRLMNCYYSNLIEGHKTHPRDIEQALNAEVTPDVVRSKDSEKRRDLLTEAINHIHVQELIDSDPDLATGKKEATSQAFIKFLHQEFYRNAPEEFRRIEYGGTSFMMIPGDYRSKADHDVIVGNHQPPSSQYVDAFMEHFEQRFRLANAGQGTRILAMAAAHHRLNYIHPFADGNGRVSRLMSHAMAYQAGISAHGLWSISRGLARGLKQRDEYQIMMDHADAPRQGDLDGRGNLSLKALENFTEWYLSVCLDQIRFMGSLFDFTTLEERLATYVTHQGLRPEAIHILHHLLLRGDMPRGDASRISGLGERTARQLVSGLTTNGIVKSDTPKSDLYLNFTVDAVEVLFPQLFPNPSNS